MANSLQGSLPGAYSDVILVPGEQLFILLGLFTVILSVVLAAMSSAVLDFIAVGFIVCILLFLLLSENYPGKVSLEGGV